MLAVNLTLDGFDIPAVFEATPEQIKQAYRRAMGKTIRWLSTRINRELGKQFDLPQRVFQVRTKRNFDNEMGSIWVGMNPIAANWLGKARQTKKGVSVRSHRFDGAFIAKMKNGHIGIFRRKTNRPLPIETVTKKMSSGGSDEIDFNIGQEISNSHLLPRIKNRVSDHNSRINIFYYLKQKSIILKIASS